MKFYVRYEIFKMFNIFNILTNFQPLLNPGSQLVVVRPLHITSPYVKWASTVYGPVDIFMKERDSSVVVITNSYLEREMEYLEGESSNVRSNISAGRKFVIHVPLAVIEITIIFVIFIRNFLLLLIKIKRRITFLYS